MSDFLGIVNKRLIVVAVYWWNVEWMQSSPAQTFAGEERPERKVSLTAV